MPGDRLPAETELPRLLLVSGGSLREAMKIVIFWLKRQSSYI